MFSDNSFTNLIFSSDAVSRPNNWPMLILCLLLLVFTLLVVSFRTKFTLILRALFSQRFYAQLVREGKVLYERVAIFSQLFNFLTLSCGILFCMAHFYPRLVEKVTYMGMYGIVLALMQTLFLFKLFINSVYAFLFEHPKERYALNLYKFIFMTNASVMLLPFILLVETTGLFTFMHVYVPVFCLLFVLFLYKIVKINPQKINLFHFFIYFCTLEILPYLLMVKVISTF